MNIQNDEITIPYYAVHKDGLIAGFFGPFRFLSNFYVLDEDGIPFEGLYYSSVETAYQAAKYPPNQRQQFTFISSGRAKELGKSAPNFDSKKWNKNKYELMSSLCWYKFSKIEKMKQMLLMTDGCQLEERNSWGDTWWGTNKVGEGQNNLGKILMNIRDRLKNGMKNEF